jgi:protein-S-isoprenylcysteine O-methyltransferase Ste14
MNEASRLPADLVAFLSGGIWALAAIFWAIVLRWEKTSVTDARRVELEQEGSGEVSPRIRAWRLLTVTALVSIPALFAIDGLVDRIRIIYAPSLSFLAGPDLVLQIVGIVLSAVALAILIGLGRKLAVHVYRLATDERRLMSTGLHRYVRHPFYLHSFLLPVGSFLLSLNYLTILLFVAYTMMWEPRSVTSWMREEEEELRRRYGGEGEAYLERTGGLFPRLRRP